ncbi:MAG: transcriptional regulator [Spirochaetes bacterium GWF1_31_7]|nr:MAG: transcriptional regulator [Spirochaetes bacterium GWE1_32_154]OHD48393.1 MAG: transcriptional regulator [Spirochaetes bacterium GWF1_31_7]OHD50486.1 MAG: transcriptional regulator [Spirochaetes bacterium GWE2_31_10]OHD82291.1 MAG: transcriptional regulator [Spirochaetes bacterium RIFOXYB1_FULL_32_8]HBD93245.1 transcriptional regulator [Spirochaetia bacterium]
MNCNSCETKQAVNTLKVAKGQIEGIINMINDERYCIDVSKQMLSVIGLLKKANSIILKQHLATCVKDAIVEGHGNEKIEEIIMILDTYMEK